MLLHESCHFYGLQWLICLFKFSIKPGGTGRIRKGEQRRVVLALQAPWGDIALPDLRSSGYSADSSHSPEQGCGACLRHSLRTAQENVNQNISSGPPPDKSFCLFLSFVQVALSRVMPLKCQLSVWACIALDIKYSSAHTKTAVSRSAIQKEIKYGACTSLFPGGTMHLLFVRVTDVFQMMVSHVCWTSTKALPRETAGMLYAIWWKPPRTQSLRWEAFLPGSLTTEREVVRVVGWGDRGAPLRRSRLGLDPGVQEQIRGGTKRQKRKKKKKTLNP